MSSHPEIVTGISVVFSSTRSSRFFFFFFFFLSQQKGQGRATSRSRSQPLTPGERETVTQINVCIANKQMRDKRKDQLPLPQAR